MCVKKANASFFTVFPLTIAEKAVSCSNSPLGSNPALENATGLLLINPLVNSYTINQLEDVNDVSSAGLVGFFSKNKVKFMTVDKQSF